MHSLTGIRDEAGTEQRSVPAYPMSRAQGCPFDPPPQLSALQAEGPLVRVRLWDGSTPWLVTRHAEQRALLADPRISADSTRPGFPHVSASLRERAQEERSFIRLDDPEHARLRRMVTAPFAVRQVESMRPGIQRIVDGLIDDLLAGPKPADLVDAFALPVPSLVICQLLGVPYADHEFFQRNSRLLINRDTPLEEGRKAQAALIAYLDDLVGDKLADPGDDLLSRLATERVRTGELTRHDLAAVGRLLLVAGHETTANMIALGTLALLQHPAQIAALRDSQDPALVAGAVEELLRYLSIVHSGRRRLALADIEIGGQVVRAGEGLIMANDIANRDESVFPGAGRLDVHRDARQHVAFGFGVHQCLGQPLARVELQVVYSTLYRRVPTLTLAADLREIPFKHDGLVYGVYELPVTW
jgi:cytochrome P450